MEPLQFYFLIHTDHITVTGKTVKENIEGAENWNKEVITPANKPFQAAGAGIVVVRGSLAPDGAIIKVTNMKKYDSKRLTEAHGGL